MNGITDREAVILNAIWHNHVYFIDPSYSYSQPLLDWAIKESNNLLNRKRIQVPSLYSKMLIFTEVLESSKTLRMQVRTTR